MFAERLFDVKDIHWFLRQLFLDSRGRAEIVTPPLETDPMALAVHPTTHSSDSAPIRPRNIASTRSSANERLDRRHRSAVANGGRLGRRGPVPAPSTSLARPDAFFFGVRVRQADRYRRRRVVALALLAGLAYLAIALLSAIASYFVGVADATETPGAPAAATYVVEPGDTLWDVAQMLNLDADVRLTVDTLADANGGPGLRPGQVLVLDSVLD